MLVDQSDQLNAGVLPPGATRQLLAATTSSRGSGCGWTAEPPGYRRCSASLAALASRAQRLVLQRDRSELAGLTFNISRSDITHDQVQQAIRPQAVALAVFGGIAALAMLVLVGQGLAQLLSRSAPDISADARAGGHPGPDSAGRRACRRPCHPRRR